MRLTRQGNNSHAAERSKNTRGHGKSVELTYIPVYTRAAPHVVSAPVLAPTMDRDVFFAEEMKFACLLFGGGIAVMLVLVFILDWVDKVDRAAPTVSWTRMLDALVVFSL